MIDQELTPKPGEGWQGSQVFILATICLMIGLAIGYLFRGSQAPAPAAQAAASTPAPPPDATASQVPTLDQMKHMADVKAEPLLLKLKTDSANADLLFEIGNVYRAAHQFKDAAGYYEKSLQVNPGNAAVGVELASTRYYAGDADGALVQLQQVLKNDPRNANALFNLGVIRFEAKKDKQGAVSAWRQLLKSNPNLKATKKSVVEKLIAQATAPGSKS